jgi:mono/diheme cytochrome c family protein
MNTKLFGLAAAAAVSLAILTGCPAEEKKETGSTTTTTTESTASGVASPEAMASEGTATTSTTTTTTTTSSTEHASPDAHGGTMAASPAAGGTMAASPAASAAGAAAGGTKTASVDAKSIFSQKCAGCHGANGGGGMGPALTTVEAKGDAHIKNRIVNGSPEKGMPAFGQQLSAAEVDGLVAYVKGL